MTQYLENLKNKTCCDYQTDLLNKDSHHLTIICSYIINIEKKFEILRLSLKKGVSNLNQDCDIMIDQIREIDNSRLNKKIGTLPYKRKYIN